MKYLFSGNSNWEDRAKVFLDTENGGGGWQHIREDQRDSGMDRKEISLKGHRTEYTDKGSGLYQRTLLGEGQFDLHVYSVLEFSLYPSSSSYSTEALCIRTLCCAIEMG